MTPKLSVSCPVLTCSRQNLGNRNKKDHAKSPSVVPAKYKSPGVVSAKYPLKVKLERISTTLEYQSWENCAYLDLWGLWDFYSSVELIFVSWRRRYFLIKKILINARILRDSFLVEIPLIKAQDISMYRHSWRSS